VEQVINDVKRHGRDAAAFADSDEIVRDLAERAGPHDVIAVLSNGTFGGIHAKLLAALDRRASSRPI
jgi:UDP-N-acetylmuramate: L-alanyl-gamma-D-glutamyl-meso-diaminopimelate ligase